MGKRYPKEFRDDVVRLARRGDVKYSQLFAQIEFAEAQQGCDCGCGTINLRVNQDKVQSAPVLKQPMPGEVDIVGEAGTVIGGLILCAREGYLSRLEIFDWGDGPSQSLPDASRVIPNLKM